MTEDPQGVLSGPIESASAVSATQSTFAGAEDKTLARLLAEQRERFEFAAASGGVGYWFCNLPFDKLIWDARVKEHFWLPSEAQVDIHLFFERLHPDDRDRTRDAIDHSIESHLPYDIEYRTVSPQGGVKWIRAIGRTEYGPSGTPVYFDGVTLDITALKQAQQALEAERQRLSTVFESAPIGMVFADATGRVLSGNRQAEQIFGHAILFTPSFERNGDWVAFHPDGRRVAAAEYPLVQAFADGGIHRGEFLYQRPDGSLRWIELTGAAVFDACGAIVGGIVAVIDIDSRKRAEEALMRSEKLALVGRLASSISHEINNPLEAVTNLLFLIQQTATDDNSRMYCQLAQQELKRVSHIVTHTLRFNRQSHSASVERISELLDSALAIYEPRIKSSGSAVERDYVADDRVLCLGSELRQVFANLIGNAFDAARNGGGRLMLRTRESVSHGRRWVRVTIADTGEGMDQATQRRIFEPFFTTKGENGTGLGLWITFEILEKHNARIRVRSSQKSGASGSVFSIWLPAAEAAPTV